MITLEDVAKEAGVSSSTVSIVVNDRRVRGVSVSPATRERVLSVARRMGYTPNSLARAVATGKNKVFGFIKNEFVSELSMRIMVGAQEESDQLDYLIKPFRIADPTLAEDVVKKCLGQRVAGIIVVNVPDETLEVILHEATLANVPVVTVDSPAERLSCVHVTSDAEQGVRQIASHLIGLGHRKLGFVGGPADSSVSEERKIIFRRACREQGVEIHDEQIVDTSWGDTEPVETGVRTLLALSSELRPSALFCAGDSIAMMTIRAARRNGLTLPKDLSVVGYSNSSFAYLCDPSLTTVAQDFLEMGRVAVRELLSAVKIQGAWEPRVIKVPTRLMVRESSWGVDWNNQ